MSASSTARGELGREVARLLRTDPEFRDYLTHVAPDGSRPVIVALVDDLIGGVFERVRSRYPDGANVIVGAEGMHGEHPPTNIVISRAPRRSRGTETLNVHVDCTVGMFMAYLVLHRGETVRVKPVGDYSAALQLEGASA